MANTMRIQSLLTFVAILSASLAGYHGPPYDVNHDGVDDRIDFNRDGKPDFPLPIINNFQQVDPVLPALTSGIGVGVFQGKNYAVRYYRYGIVTLVSIN